MSIEVPCPNCQSVLKAPDGMAGKKARCKKCQHSFRIPGEAAGPVDSVADSEHLSAIAPSPFAFDGSAEATPVSPPPPAKPTRAVKPAVAEKRKAPAPVDDAEPIADNPFSIPSTAISDDETPPEAKSKSKYRKGDSKADAKVDSKVEKSKSKSRQPAAAKTGGTGGGVKKILMFGVVGLLCAAAGGAGIYFFMLPKDKATTPLASAPTVPDKPAPVVAEKAKDDKKATAANLRKRAASNEPNKVSVESKPEAGAKAKSRVALTISRTLDKIPDPTKLKVIEKPKDVLSLDHNYGSVRKLIVGGKDGPVAVVIRHTFDGFQGKGAKETIDRYALTTGQRVDRTEIDADGLTWPRATDISPNGERLAIDSPTGKVTIYQLSDKGKKLLDGFDPYPEAKGKPPGIAAVYFLEDNSIAVVSKEGTVDVFDITTKAKTVTGKPLPAVPTMPLVENRSVVISPDRKLIAAYAGSVVYEIPTATCEPKVGTTLGNAPMEGLALAIDQSGTRFAVAYKAGQTQGADAVPYTRIAHARFGDPEPKTDQPVNEEFGVPSSCAWVNPEAFVMVSTNLVGFLFDADQGGDQIVVGLRPPNAGVFCLYAQDRYWCLLGDPTDAAKKSILVGTPFPPQEYLPLVSAGKEKPVALQVTAKGIAK